MEREATGERTREAIAHIHRNGYFFGKVPYGYKAVPAPDNPRYRVLAEDPEQQKVLAEIKNLSKSRELTELASLLNAQGLAPPQGKKWTRSLVYNLKRRKGWITSRPVNKRSHTDEEVKLRMQELRDRGTTYQGIANILNEQGYLPYKGQKFTVSGVCQLLNNSKETKFLAPRAFCESVIRRSQGERPSYPALARMLLEGGFLTPRGNTHWWPAQVQQLLDGKFDKHYRGNSAAAHKDSGD